MRLGFLLASLLLLGGCRPAAPVAESSPSPSPHPRLQIVTTFAPVYCFTKNIVGDLADVSMLAAPGQDVPSPADLAALKQADVVVENGFGFESWLDRNLSCLKPGALRIVAGRGIQPLASGTAAADEMSLPVTNPYVWLDPLNAITEVQNIRDQLMLRDPVHADEFLRRENEYETALRDLDTEIGNTLVDCTRRKLFRTDSAFDWFLARYELQSAGDPALPSATLDPMTRAPASADSYETISRANAAALQKALR